LELEEEFEKQMKEMNDLGEKGEFAKVYIKNL